MEHPPFSSFMATKRARTSKGSTSKGGSTQNPRRTRGNPVSNPYGIEFRNNEQRDRYNMLVKRKIFATRYVDDSALQTLGLLDDIRWMFDRVGWNYFMSLKSPTYVKLTLEFLSSIETQVITGRECDKGRVAFRLFNNEHVLTLSEFNAIYHLPDGGARRLSKDFSDHGFWNDISGKVTYQAALAKASNIYNPCFKYVQRLMANTLFGRGESEGVARQTELYFLWAMIENFDIDTGAYLARQFERVAKASKGGIVIGGLITPIAIALNYANQISELAELQGNTRIDLEACLAIKMITKLNDVYHLILPDGSTMALPNPVRTTVRNRANWKFEGVTDEPEEPYLQLPPPSEPNSPSSSHHHENPDLNARMATMEEEQQRQGHVLDRMNTMMSAMYNWHISQGHFPPLP